MKLFVQETCKAIVEHLLPQYIHFPFGEQLNTIVDDFEHMWGIPQCIGAIDRSHVPVYALLLNHTDYYNRKGWYSVLFKPLSTINTILYVTEVGNALRDLQFGG